LPLRGETTNDTTDSKQMSLLWTGLSNAATEAQASRNDKCRDVMEPAKIRIKSVGCGFVTLSKLVPAITDTAIQLSYLKLNSYKRTSSE